MVDNPFENRIWEQLATVFDPEVPVNIVELGLIYKVDFPTEDSVVIDMTLTAPACPIADDIVEQARAAVAGIDGLKSVTVNLVFEPEWTPERMTEAARLELGFGID